MPWRDIVPGGARVALAVLIGVLALALARLCDVGAVTGEACDLLGVSKSCASCCPTIPVK